MARQKSQQTSRKASDSPNSRRRSGTLFIVGTPIGSLDDLTIRARAVLGEVSIVAAENPLVTQALLAKHRISATITSYGRRDENKIAVLLDRLKAGHDIALVSDCGMPVIYDPGRLLITAARDAGYPVTVVPGPSAVTAAAALSGYSGDRLLFLGRVPRTRPHLDQLCSTLKRESATAIMFVHPPILPHILNSIRRVLPNRAVTLAVNITKKDERVCQGSATSLLEIARSLPQDAELTLVLAGVRKR
ncbi:MAG TPA: SAM-dependent methyltransferase [Nitrospira sp.]|nr:SAM-dependent methyltransferase [Nitrospira sp.]